MIRKNNVTQNCSNMLQSLIAISSENFMNICIYKYSFLGMISNKGFWPEAEGEEADEIDKFVGTGPMCRYAKDLPLLAEIMSEERINFSRKVTLFF